MPLDRCRERFDIGGLVLIGRHSARCRHEAHLDQRFEELVVDRCRRRRRILRVEREHQDALAALFVQPLQRLLDRRLAIAHAPIDNDLGMGGEGGAKLFALRAGIGAQRQLVALAVPDLVIERAGFFRTGVEHDAVEHRQPDGARPLDDAFVGKEFLEVAPHRFLIGAVRRAEIDEEHADLRCLDAWMVFRLCYRFQHLARNCHIQHSTSSRGTQVRRYRAMTACK